MHDSSNLCLEGETLRQGAHTRKKKYMQVVFDNMFYYSPCAHTKAVCHLKVLVGNSATLTIATEVPQGYAWSIARSPEILAAHAINVFQLNPAINTLNTIPLQRNRKYAKRIPSYAQSKPIFWSILLGRLPMKY